MADKKITLTTDGSRGGVHSGVGMENMSSLIDAMGEDEYRQYVLEKIKRGQERARIEGAIPHEDVKQRLKGMLEQ